MNPVGVQQELQIWTGGALNIIELIKTVAFIVGKKIQQSKKNLFVFPLKIPLKTSVCMS